MSLPKIHLMFKWFDLWIGAYWDVNSRCLYVCPFPMCVIKIEMRGSGPATLQKSKESWEE
jgi:hypothetical protein